MSAHTNPRSSTHPQPTSAQPHAPTGAVPGAAGDGPTLAAAGSRSRPSGQRAGQKRRERRSGGGWLYLSAGVLLSILFVGPLLLAALRSLQPATALRSAPAQWLDGGLSLSNYTDLFTQLDFLRFVGNSLVTAGGASLATAVLATLAGYGLGRFTFRGQSLVLGAILVALMVPFQALLTPIYLQLDALGLVDTQLGLVIFYTTFALPFGTFVMRNTFAAMPRELEEAAHLDGLGALGTLLRVLRPLALPGVATTLIFTFLSCWTEFLGAFTFLTSADKLTLPIALLNIATGTYGQVNYGYLLAGNILSMIPCIVLYVALQRYYLRGLAAGAVRA